MIRKHVTIEKYSFLIYKISRTVAVGRLSGAILIWNLIFCRQENILFFLLLLHKNGYSQVPILQKVNGVGKSC